MWPQAKVLVLRISDTVTKGLREPAYHEPLGGWIEYKRKNSLICTEHHSFQSTFTSIILFDPHNKLLSYSVGIPKEKT